LTVPEIAAVVITTETDAIEIDRPTMIDGQGTGWVRIETDTASVIDITVIVRRTMIRRRMS